MTGQPADLRARIHPGAGTPYTFVIHATRDQPVAAIEQTIATWLGLDSAEALKGLAVSVSRMPGADTGASIELPQDHYVAVNIPIVEPVTPEQLFEIARQIRDAGPFKQVDADVPVSYFVPERDGLPGDRTANPPLLTSAISIFGGNCSPESSGEWPWPADWSLSAMNVQKAWDMGSKGQGVAIALIDTGWAPHTHIDAAVFDLAHCRDLVDGDSDPTDPLDPASKGFLRFPGHGTATASVACALRQPADAEPAEPAPLSASVPASAFVSVSWAISVLVKILAWLIALFVPKKAAAKVAPQPPKGMISGVAPQAKVIPIRFTNTVAAVTGQKLVEAIDCMVELKKSAPDAVHIISLSQGSLPFPWVRDAIRRAVAQNLIVVASAGNWPKPVIWPAAFPECIAVAGISPDKHPWPCTARGAAVAFCTPAGSVWRATFKPDPDDDAKLKPSFEPGSGTSFSAPQAAGVAALWLAHFTPAALRGICEAKGLVMQELFRTLAQQTAYIPADFDGNAWMEEYGAGIIDAEALLKADPGLATAGGALPILRPVTTAALVSEMAEDYATESTRGTLREIIPSAVGPGGESWRGETFRSTLQVYAELLGVDAARVAAVLESNRAEVLYILLERPDIFDQLVREIIQRSAEPPGAIRAPADAARFMSLRQAFRAVASPALLEE